MKPVATPEKILSFWFEGKEEFLPKWFQKDPTFDERIKDNFFATLKEARAQKLSAWISSAQSCLALIIVLDQFSRNIFRGRRGAFESDNDCLSIAKKGIRLGHDKALPPLWRIFFYLPFEHSENILDQEKSLALISSLKGFDFSDDIILYAQQHYDVIKKFGRFPHRNKALGRVSTPEELDYLEKNGGF